MMNKLDALKFFVAAAETMNFREAAVRLAISPSVVTRTIAELENQLGEPLFKRNTRSIVLTSFGELFLPKAMRLLEDSEALFQTARDDNDMKGVVRITLFRFVHPLGKQQTCFFKNAAGGDMIFACHSDNFRQF